jgi:hypothetical protein
MDQEGSPIKEAFGSDGIVFFQEQANDANVDAQLELVRNRSNSTSANA